MIELVQTSASSGPAPQLDLGLSEDLFRLENDHYVATVSNLGSLDYAGGAATLELVAESTTESMTIPALPAPPVETLSLHINHSGDEITKENNSVTKTFRVPEPGVAMGLGAGLALLWALARRRHGLR